jgi:NAD(P)-dependent dehydrogenase (short-subunit alcohol dehydrogenase family)
MTPSPVKTALITGAAGGIGHALCAEFTAAGWRVIGVDRIADKGKHQWEFIPFDLTELPESPAAAAFFKQVRRICGSKLNALVNNAAVQVVKPISEVTAGDWDASLRVNLLAPFWLTQRLLPMLKASRGSVVNIVSIHARLTKANFPVYAATKGGLAALTRALALELAPEVRVNAVAPAATDTPMLRAGFGKDIRGLKKLGDYHPLGRIATPQEVAQAALWLASDKASFVTGTVLDVDGGIGAVLHEPEQN